MFSDLNLNSRRRRGQTTTKTHGDFRFCANTLHIPTIQVILSHLTHSTQIPKTSRTALQEEMWVTIESVSYHHVITGIVTWQTFFPASDTPTWWNPPFFLCCSFRMHDLFSFQWQGGSARSFLLKNKHLERARRKIFRMSRGFCCFDCSSLPLSQGSYLPEKVFCVPFMFQSLHRHSWNSIWLMELHFSLLE